MWWDRERPFHVRLNDLHVQSLCEFKGKTRGWLKERREKTYTHTMTYFFGNCIVSSQGCRSFCSWLLFKQTTDSGGRRLQLREKVFIEFCIQLCVWLNCCAFIVSPKITSLSFILLHYSLLQLTWYCAHRCGVCRSVIICFNSHDEGRIQREMWEGILVQIFLVFIWEGFPFTQLEK